MKFRSHRCPSSQTTCTSARYSPSLVNDDANHPVAPSENATRTAVARSATAPPASAKASATYGSATAATTDSPPPHSRMQSRA